MTDRHSKTELLILKAYEVGGFMGLEVLQAALLLFSNVFIIVAKQKEQQFAMHSLFIVNKTKDIIGIAFIPEIKH